MRKKLVKYLKNQVVMNLPAAVMSRNVQYKEPGSNFQYLGTNS